MTHRERVSWAGLGVILVAVWILAVQLARRTDQVNELELQVRERQETVTKLERALEHEDVVCADRASMVELCCPAFSR